MFLVFRPAQEEVLVEPRLRQKVKFRETVYLFDSLKLGNKKSCSIFSDEQLFIDYIFFEKI
ncbi:hypothetical protein ALGA_3870 [Labilibaculum antarcticum]|uniref:Uncharacterized protein n=1 Tax=Labilibaculum antarcticum TaxID=1717717 RepID=A0A1Y1CQE2_9BACT|nr:hypothetical protein ALGA_3870 [Labilibaculum antarcticum]